MAINGKHRGVVTRVVAFCGLPGAGKSTLALALAERTGWRRLDRDAMRVELGLGYRDKDKARLRQAMLSAMRDALERNESVIIDGMTFSKAAERCRFQEVAEALGAEWTLIWLECAPALARDRVACDSAHPAADRSPGLVDDVLSRFETPTDALRIDAAGPTEGMLDQLLRRLPDEEKT